MTPRPRLLLAIILILPLSAACVFSPALREIGILANLVLMAIAIADILATPPLHLIAVERDSSAVLSVGTPNPVTLTITNKSRHPLHLELIDEPPQPSRVTDLPPTVELTPWKEHRLTYHLIPHRRGVTRFSAVHLRYPSLLGFWNRVERRPLETPVRIYPDIRTVSRFDLLARKNRLAEMGLKVWRLKGQGGEFERLREYRLEDEMRQVDWKATAKHRRLISREFTVERNQNILVLLDCGRSMCNETEGISHLDHGLNASIMLSYIALGQGDNVGLIAFSNRIERSVGPVRGKPAIQTIISSTFDLEPQTEASDYDLVWEELSRRYRKRALVVLITHALDEQHLLSIGSYARVQTTSHLVLLVVLQDVGLVQFADSIPRDDVGAFQAAAAAELLNQQSRRIEELRASGVLVLETLPGKLSSDVINQYLDLKARHLL